MHLGRPQGRPSFSEVIFYWPITEYDCESIILRPWLPDEMKTILC